MSQITPGSSTATGRTPAGTSGSPVRELRPRPSQPSATDPSDLPAYPPDGRSTRWVDHREARRAELVRVARRTVHHRGPDVSMEEIAAAAGTSKSIVYRYFADKTGLQIAVAEAVVLQIQGALEGVLRVAPTPREGLRAMVAVYLEMIESSPHVYAFVTRDGSVESGGPLGHFLDSVTALVAAPFARAMAEEHTGSGVAGGPATGSAAVAGGADGTLGDDPARLARQLAEPWAAGAVGFVRGAGEWWMAHRDEPGAPDRQQLTANVAAWLWAGPVGLLARGRTNAGTPHDPPLDPPIDQ